MKKEFTLMKKIDRTMPLRQYLIWLRTNDEFISKGWKTRTTAEKAPIKSTMTTEFIERCGLLKLSMRDIALVLQCSSGTISNYINQYYNLLADDIAFEEADYRDYLKEMVGKTEYIGYYGDEAIDQVFLLISDIQAGALVTSDGWDMNPEETINEYFDILFERLYASIVQRRLQIKTFNLVLLGDLVEGWKIFPKQMTVPIRKQKEIVVKNLLRLIHKIVKIYTPEQLHIYGVYGNHGKGSWTSPSEDNFDLFAMEEMNIHLGYLKQIDEDYEKVTSFVSSKEIQKHMIGNHEYIILHGDQMSGFNLGSWANQSNDLHVSFGGFDALLMGHWHNHAWFNNKGMDIVVNGCMYRSEFVQNRLRGRESVSQTFFGANEIDPVTWMDRLDIDQGIYIPEER
jgi:predicted phosphodiesterase